MWDASVVAMGLPMAEFTWQEGHQQAIASHCVSQTRCSSPPGSTVRWFGIPFYKQLVPARGVSVSHLDWLPSFAYYHVVSSLGLRA